MNIGEILMAVWFVGGFVLILVLAIYAEYTNANPHFICPDGYVFVNKVDSRKDYCIPGVNPIPAPSK